MKTKKAVLSVALVIILFSCSTGKKEQSSTFSDSTETQANISTVNTIKDDSIVLFKQLFQIPTKDFFFGKALDVISAGEQHESSFYVPLKLVVKDSKFYIPNLDQKQIWVFSKSGKKIDDVLFPAQMPSLDFFEILNDGILVASSFSEGKIYEVTNNGKIAKAVESQDVRFAAFDDNYVYRFENRFFDRQNLFSNKFTFDFSYNSYDYFLTKDALFVASFESDSLKISQNLIDGEVSQKLIGNLDLKNYEHPYILRFAESKLLILLDPVFGRKSLLKAIFYDFRNQKHNIKYLKNPLEGEALIGEGSVLWGAGMVFSYYDNKLYIMYTSKDAIRIFEYDI